MRTCPACDLCFADETVTCPADGVGAEPDFAGSRLIDGKYAIERRLGQGGMGVVYRARHEVVDRAFALKLMRGPGASLPGYLARFRTEAAALGRLKHPSIVDVTDFGVDPREGGMPYLVMEYLEGRPLSESCRDGRRLSPEEALPVLSALADAIDFAHEHGVLHRDLKPGNVLLESDGAGGRRAKVLDFGLARLEGRAGPRVEEKTAPARMPQEKTVPAISMREGVAVTGTVPTLGVTALVTSETWSTPAAPDGFTSTGEVAGTLSYMAPELLRGGEASRATDLYAFGVLAYEVLVGRRPFSGRAEDVVEGHLHGEPMPPAQAGVGLATDFDAPLVAALAKDPAHRPPSARAYVGAIRAAAHAVRAREWRAREVPRRLAAAVVIAVLASAAAAAAVRTPAGASLEARTVDARFAWQPARPPHSALRLVVVDEATLTMDATPLSARAGEFARLLDGVFAAGARGVALDLVLPPTWSRSPEFSQAVLRHADALVLASVAAPDGSVVGPEALAGLTAAALGPERTAALFGLANFVEDGDGVIRRARWRHPLAGGGEHAALAARAASLLGWGPTRSAPETFWLDHTADWPHAPRISWKDLGARLSTEPDGFRGKLVVIGADYSGSGDAHRVPSREGLVEVPGFVLQGLITDTLLAGFPYREASAWPVITAAALGAAAMAGTLLCVASLRPAWAMLGLLAAAAVVVPVLAFRGGVILPILPSLGCLLLSAPAALWLRARLPRFPSDPTEPHS